MQLMIDPFFDGEVRCCLAVSLYAVCGELIGEHDIAWPPSAETVFRDVVTTLVS